MTNGATLICYGAGILVGIGAMLGLILRIMTPAGLPPIPRVEEEPQPAPDDSYRLEPFERYLEER